MLILAAAAWNLLSTGTDLPALPSLASLRGATSGITGSGAMFPDALGATKPGQPVLMNSPGDFYSRVGGRDSWLLLFHSKSYA